MAKIFSKSMINSLYSAFALLIITAEFFARTEFKGRSLTSLIDLVLRLNQTSGKPPLLIP
jgi:hypothetical protein